MSGSRIKRPRVALVSYAEEHYDKLPDLMESLAAGEVHKVYATTETALALHDQGFRVPAHDWSRMGWLNLALREEGRRHDVEMPSIDMLCVTFTDLSKFEDEFGHTNDTQDMEIITDADLDRVALVLSACAGRRVVTAKPGWERGTRIDLLEARTENEAWIAGRIREAMQEVNRYVGALAKFQEEFALRMSVSPRTNRPSRTAMCTCGALFFQHTDSGVDAGAACHSFTPKK